MQESPRPLNPTDPEWGRLTSQPALDPEAWDLDSITTEPGSVTLHDKHHGTWTIAGFPEPQDVIAFMLTGDHQPGTPDKPNDYETHSGHHLLWTKK